MAHLAASLHRLREANKELTLEIARLKADHRAQTKANDVDQLQADIATLRFENAGLQSENDRLQALIEGFQPSPPNSAETSFAVVPHMGDSTEYTSSSADAEQLEVTLAPAPDWRHDVQIISAILAQHDGRFREQNEQSSSLWASIEEHDAHRKRLDDEIAALKRAGRGQSMSSDRDLEHELENKVKYVVAKLNARLTALESDLEAVKVASKQAKNKQLCPKNAELTRLAARTADLEDFKASLETRLRHEDVIEAASDKEILLHMFKKLSANMSGSVQQVRRAGPFEGDAKEFRRLRQRVLLRIVTFDSMLSKGTELMACTK